MQPAIFWVQIFERAAALPDGGQAGAGAACRGRRGGKARKRDLLREQVPVPVAADRGGETLSHTLPALNADSVKAVLGRSSPRMPCRSPTPTAAIRPSRRRSTSPLPASESGARCTSRNSQPRHHVAARGAALPPKSSSRDPPGPGQCRFQRVVRRWTGRSPVSSCGRETRAATISRPARSAAP